MTQDQLGQLVPRYCRTINRVINREQMYDLHSAVWNATLFQPKKAVIMQTMKKTIPVQFRVSANVIAAVDNLAGAANLDRAEYLKLWLGVICRLRREHAIAAITAIPAEYFKSFPGRPTNAAYEAEAEAKDGLGASESENAQGRLPASPSNGNNPASRPAKLPKTVSTN